MRRAVAFAGLLGLTLGAFYLAEGLRYPLGTLAQPGPGLYPALIGALVVVGGLGTALEARHLPAGVACGWPRGPALRRVLALIAAAFAYVVVLPYVGHVIAAAPVTLTIMRVMGLRSWPKGMGLTLAMALGSYYLFAILLRVPLPGGMWTR